jgi:hypothetical protein
MSITIYSPVCKVEAVERKGTNRVDTLADKRIGLVFNKHASAVAFWNALEREVKDKLHPSAIRKLDKTNTWAAAPGAEMQELIRNTDLALVGVGA